MILSTMLYAVCIAALLGLFALVSERICGELRWARRAPWILALVASLTIPAYSFLIKSDGAEGGLVSLPFAIDLLPDVLPGDVRSATGDDSADTTWLTWLEEKSLDDMLLGLWLGSSALMLLVLLVASLQLSWAIRRLETRTIDADCVVLAERLGPAVYGFLAPRIILPKWLADGDAALRKLVLAHERKHIAARDQMILLGALLLVAAMPWNPALWWQLRRLRAAIEVDCDARVLADGADAASYSEALLSVRLRAGNAPLGAVALSEPVSDLERRIRIMLEESRRFSLPRVGARMLLALVLAGLAVSLDAPRAQPGASDGDADEPARVPAMRESVYLLMQQAQSCAEQEDFDCARDAVNAAATMNLNDYENAQLWYFRAFLHFQEEDIPRTIAAYENVLRIGDSVPEALRQRTLLSLAQLYTANEQYEQGLEALDEWFDREQAHPEISFVLRANIEYQLGRYEAALQSIREAIERAAEPDEGWYTMQMALQLEQGDESGAIETLELLNAKWPSPERARRLEELKASAN